MILFDVNEFFVRSTEELHQAWVNNNKNFLKTAKEFGMSDNGVRKRFKTCGII